MKNWKTVAVPPNTPLETAIGALDEAGLSFVLVPNADAVLYVAGSRRAAKSSPGTEHAGGRGRCSHQQL